MGYLCPVMSQNASLRLAGRIRMLALSSTAAWLMVAASCGKTDLSKPTPAEEYNLSAAEVQSLARLATSGNGGAAMRLGYYYQLSAGSRKEAVKWFEKARANGVREAEAWLRGNETQSAPMGNLEPWVLTEPVTLAEAASRFNQRYRAELTATSEPPLSEAELRNALALGSGAFLRPEKPAVADLCTQVFESGVLPKGSELSIWVGETVGRGQKEQFRPFFFIHLRLTTAPATAELPVRLVPRKLEGR